ncbi:uncharacterized protein LOC142930149 isoform X2 [Petromyzon marinus]|uniref:uncharacterized protein LOC142930149 isoform X2 n=1 Tax=Petromyzon marinus TaxID=7757 RepID=UPI003F6E93DE
MEVDTTCIMNMASPPHRKPSSHFFLRSGAALAASAAAIADGQRILHPCRPPRLKPHSGTASLSSDQDPPVAESRSARSSPARGATGSPTTPRTPQLGSAPSCGAASVVGTQHQRRHSPTWNCAQVLALPGAAGMATMQRKLAGKKQGVGGFLLTATIGDNYLCQPHDGATRGGARPAVAATASCPTPHATARGTLRPCGVTDSRAELVRVRSKCHRRCQPRALCPVSSPMLPNCTTVNLTGRYEMTFSSTSTPTSVLNSKKPLYWTRPLHTAHLIVPFPPWATSCVASFLPIEYSYVDVSDSKQYSSSVKMWTTDLSQTPILHRGPHALHTSSEPQQRRLDVPACPLNDT